MSLKRIGNLRVEKRIKGSNKMSVFESVSYVRDIQTHTYQPATLVSQYTTRSFSVRACIQYLYTCVYTYDVQVSLKRCTRDSGKYGGQDIHWLQQKKKKSEFYIDAAVEYTFSMRAIQLLLRSAWRA